jgi:hypothetical protein
LIEGNNSIRVRGVGRDREIGIGGAVYANPVDSSEVGTANAFTALDIEAGYLSSGVESVDWSQPMPAGI